MTRSGNSRRIGLDRKSFEAIAETIPHIVWLADASGSTDYFNVMGTDYTGSRGEPTTRFAHRTSLRDGAQNLDRGLDGTLNGGAVNNDRGSCTAIRPGATTHRRFA